MQTLLEGSTPVSVAKDFGLWIFTIETLLKPHLCPFEHYAHTGRHRLMRDIMSIEASETLFAKS